MPTDPYTPKVYKGDHEDVLEEADRTTPFKTEIRRS